MFRDSIGAYRARAVDELERAFVEEYTPHQVAASFGIGVFVTALPTLGSGLLLFLVLARAFDWISKVALFSSVVVLNPAVKPAVYVASYWLGAKLFDPEPVVLFDVVVLDHVVDVTRRLLVGNLLIALALAAVGYVAVRRLATAYQRQLETGRPR